MAEGADGEGDVEAGTAEGAGFVLVFWLGVEPSFELGAALLGLCFEPCSLLLHAITKLNRMTAVSKNIARFIDLSPCKVYFLYPISLSPLHHASNN